MGMQLKSDAICSHQLPCNLLVQDFFHSQSDDGFVAAFEEGFDFLQSIRGIIEGDEEAPTPSKLKGLWSNYPGLPGSGNLGLRGATSLRLLGKIHAGTPSNCSKPAI